MKTMYLSYSFLLSKIVNDKDNKITDEHLKDSLYYFGCHSDLAFDWNTYCENYSWLNLEKMKPAWDRLKTILNADNSLFRKNLEKKDHFNTLNHLLVKNGLNPIEITVGLVVKEQKAGNFMSDYITTSVNTALDMMNLFGLKDVLNNTNPDLNVVW